MIRPTPQAKVATRRRLPRARGRHLDEHYRALVRRLRSMENGVAAPQVVGVTGCERGDGVSTIAANLAVQAAAMLDRPVLLVDANVQNPSVERNFQLPWMDGFLEALASEAEPSECVLDGPLENLRLMTAGGGVNGRPPCYEPEAVKSLFASLRPDYALIVVDLPPATALSPTPVMAGGLDGVLLVLGAQRVRREAATRAKRLLEESGGRLLGVVMNKARDDRG